MPIYFGRIRQNELYYGGTKIKEAYYGSTKVYGAAPSQTIRFDYTGAAQTWTVPAGCTKLIVDCVGAAGGPGNTVSGGLGGRVQCTLSVTSGQILNIYVGGVGKYTSPNGTSAGGWNGGGNGYSVQFTFGSASYYHCGGGGGASDIRIGGTELTDRKIVAGGGGGSFRLVGSSNLSIVGGAGGDLIGEQGGSWSGSGASSSGGGGGTQQAFP